MAPPVHEHFDRQTDAATPGPPGETGWSRLAVPEPGQRRGSFLDAAPLDDELALIEAARCLHCGGLLEPAPCNAACPSGIDVSRFVAAIARGSWEEAAQLIFAENLLAASCARVCPADELCEGACVLTREGASPIAIARLERYATDLAHQHPWATYRTSALPTGKRVTVIGAGPAGLVCAGELAGLGHAVTVYEARDAFGGMLRLGLEPSPIEAPALPGEVRGILALGVGLYLDQPVDSPERLWEIEAHSDAIFVGIGLLRDPELHPPGSHLPGVMSAPDFVEGLKRGALRVGGRRVAVIGGGNAAIDAAREAVRAGAAGVEVLYRRTAAEMPAYRSAIEAAQAEGVEFRWLTGPVRFVGDEMLTGVECQRMRLEPCDGSERLCPAPVRGSEFVVPAEIAVRATGRRSPLEFLRWIDGLDLEDGRPRVDQATGQTTNPKYFAGGAVVDGGAPVAEAVRAGKRAARGIDAWLRLQDRSSA